MAKPKYTMAKGSVQIDLHSVIDIVSELDRTGHLEDLRSHLEQHGAYVFIASKHVNRIKKYLFDKKLHETSDIARDIVRPTETVGMITGGLAHIALINAPAADTTSTADPDCCKFQRR